MYLYGNIRSLRCEIQRECDSLCLIKNLRTWKHVFLNPDICIHLVKNRRCLLRKTKNCLIQSNDCTII